MNDWIIIRKRNQAQTTLTLQSKKDTLTAKLFVSEAKEKLSSTSNNNFQSLSDLVWSKWLDLLVFVTTSFSVKL